MYRKLHLISDIIFFKFISVISLSDRILIINALQTVLKHSFGLFYSHAAISHDRLSLMDTIYIIFLSIVVADNWQTLKFHFARDFSLMAYFFETHLPSIICQFTALLDFLIICSHLSCLCLPRKNLTFLNMGMVKRLVRLFLKYGVSEFKYLYLFS